jgi:hypothetical protein
MAPVDGACLRAAIRAAERCLPLALLALLPLPLPLPLPRPRPLPLPLPLPLPRPLPLPLPLPLRCDDADTARLLSARLATQASGGAPAQAGSLAGGVA